LFFEPEGPFSQVFAQGPDGEVLLAADKGLYGAADIGCFHDQIGVRCFYICVADRRFTCHKYILSGRDVQVKERKLDQGVYQWHIMSYVPKI